MKLARALKLLALVGGLLMLAAIVRHVGLEALRAELGRLGWGLLLFLLPSFLFYALDNEAWIRCFPARPPLSFARMFQIRMAGEALNAVIPAAYMGGEPAKALLLQRVGVPGPAGLASVIVAKTAMTLAQIAFVLVALGCALGAQAQGGELGAEVLWGCAGCALIGLLCMGLAYAGQRYGLGRLLLAASARLRVARAWVEARREPLERMDAALTEAYTEGRGRFWQASALFFLAWSLESLEVWAFVAILGVPAGGLEVVAIAGLATVIKAAGFLIPASLGAQEGGNVLLFVALGLGPVLGLTYSIARRARELLWLAIGLLCFAGARLQGDEPARPAAGGE